MPTTHQVLWTSGWDSTYRVVDLLLNGGATVQPWYVLDSGRRSTAMELRTQDRIRAELTALDPSVTDRLMPVRTVPIRDIPADPEVTAQHRALLRRSFLGGQYDWLARLAKAENVTLELSVHRDDKAHAFLESEVISAGATTRLPRSVSDWALRLFQDFEFPLFDLTKLDMQHAAELSGFGPVLESTWFCFNPLAGGQPCGYCNPCRYTREEGLGRRVPRQSPLRRVRAATAQVSWSIWQKARTMSARPHPPRQPGPSSAFRSPISAEDGVTRND